MNFYVYLLRRPDKEDPLEFGRACPFYVGKGNNGRKDFHRREAQNCLGKSVRKSHKINTIHSLWRQRLDFEIDILFDNLTEEEAFEYEKMAISAYGRKDNGTGILANLTDGGEGPAGQLMVITEEMKRKMREAWKIGLQRGRPHTDEAKRKMREAKKGKPPSYQLTEQIRAKMRMAAKKRWESEEYREKMRADAKKCYESEDERRKVSERRMGMKFSPEHRKNIGLASRRMWKNRREINGY